MELFVNEPSLTFEPSPGMAKKAATQLDEDPQRWARQVLTELFRQVPDSSESVSYTHLTLPTICSV